MKMLIVNFFLDKSKLDTDLDNYFNTNKEEAKADNTN